jgi:hypothetical protein
MTATKIVLLSFLVVTLATAGTLDNAPFKIVLPSGNWKLSDSTAQDIEKNVFLVASITNINTQSKSLILKTILDKPTTSSLDEYSAGMWNTLSKLPVKSLSEESTTFLGFKARRFTYEVNGTGYNETVAFVSGNTCWSIMCVGVVSKETEVQNLFTFYQKANN